MTLLSTDKMESEGTNESGERRGEICDAIAKISANAVICERRQHTFSRQNTRSHVTLLTKSNVFTYPRNSSPS